MVVGVRHTSQYSNSVPADSGDSLHWLFKGAIVIWGKQFFLGTAEPRVLDWEAETPWESFGMTVTGAMPVSPIGLQADTSQLQEERLRECLGRQAFPPSAG